VKSYLLNCILTGNVYKIPCCIFECPNIFEEKDIERLVDSESLKKYKKFLKNYLLINDPNLKWCPTPDCEGYYSTVQDKSSNNQ